MASRGTRTTSVLALCQLIATIIGISQFYFTAAAAAAGTAVATEPLSFRLQEELPAGTVLVRDVLDDTGLGARYPDPVARSALRFELLGGGGTSQQQQELAIPPAAAGDASPSGAAANNWFRLEGRSVVTSAVLDRDALCPRAVDCPLDFKLAVVSTARRFQVARLKLFIVNR